MSKVGITRLDMMHIDGWNGTGLISRLGQARVRVDGKLIGSMVE